MTASASLWPKSLWIVGCGTMGGAMLRRWIAAGLDAASVTVVNRTRRAMPEGVRVLTAIPDDPAPEVLLIGFKPQQLDEAAPTLAGVSPKLLLSILAGVDVATLAARIPAAAIVRAMPNLPVALGAGVTALYTANDDRDVVALAEALATSLGTTAWIEDEAKFDAVTALSGCGPAFVFRVIDALARAGAGVGLDPDLAARLALATVHGSALMAKEADVSPAILADRVASPGGSTRAGLDVLDADGALDALFARTLTASEARNREMAEAARKD